MRKIISKSTAIRVVVLAFALLGILSIFPLRLFTSVIETSGGGTIVSESHFINYENSNLMQEFVAQYDRLSSIDVYVTKVEQGRYIAALLYDENGQIIFKAYQDTEEYQIPGYVTIPIEKDLEVGTSYAIRLADCRSKYYVALEDIPAQPEYVGNLTWNYGQIEGLHLAAIYKYRVPLPKGRSLALIGIIAALAAVICLLTGIYFRRNPEKNDIVTVQSAVKAAANPVAALFFGALVIMVFPLKVFDSRPLDIIFYEIGILVAAFIVFYAINHKPVKHEVGISFWQSLRNEDRAQYLAIMFSMAMAIWYGSQYMNDLYDIYHSISERQMTMWLLIMMLFTFTLKEFFNLYNLVWVAGAGLYGFRFYNLNKMADTEFEYDLHNLVLKYSIIIAVLAGLLVLNFVRIVFTGIRDIKSAERHGEKIHLTAPTFFGVLIIALFVTLIIFRNTRLWGIYLAVVYTAFYIRLGSWHKKKDYFKLLSGGLMMNFAISMVYCWLHRYFTGYVSGRYGFIFHTVTVTAEYLTFMGAVALVMLSVKVIALPKETNLKGVFVSAWKEMTLFGFIMSYAIFTVSRTAYLAIAGTALIMVLVVLACHRKQFFRILAVMIVSLVLCFPSAFTLQRIFPTMVAKPVFYPIDDADPIVRGGANWDSTNFMCVERFVNLFENKILGMDVGDFHYPDDENNYDGPLGEPLYDYYGRPYADSPDNPDYKESGAIELPADEAKELLAAVGITRAELDILKDEIRINREEMVDYIDWSNPLDVLSNGRITIFKSYFAQLNMTGHEEMGTMLPNGEIAIHAHNTYLQVAYDNGIPVGILFMVTLAAGLIFGIIYYIKNKEDEPLSLITPAIIIGFAVAGISEWVFQYSNPMTIALMLSLAPLTFRTKEK